MGGKISNFLRQGYRLASRRWGLEHSQLEPSCLGSQRTLPPSRLHAGEEGEAEALRASVADYKEKLRNAVKKGKAIEAEKRDLQSQLEALQQQQRQRQPAGGPGWEEEAEALRASLEEYKEKLRDMVETGKGLERERDAKVMGAQSRGSGCFPLCPHLSLFCFRSLPLLG